MLTPDFCLKLIGPPEFEKDLILWYTPKEIIKGSKLPARIYCHAAMVEPLNKAFLALRATGCIAELKTWDGCFNVRKMRGSNKMSIHSWALAIDVNAAENGLNKTPKLSPQFVECFTSNGFVWGGKWKRQDGMHFQLTKEIVNAWYN